ncbi:MAG: hypothetical protein LUQ71_10535 [Methanoregula sp.]|nr:hypothetical protein [Methanoregula sp.]
MNLNLNAQMLNKIIIVLVAGMIITGVIVGLKVAGVFGQTAKTSPDTFAANTSGGITVSDAGSEPASPGTSSERGAAGNSSGRSGNTSDKKTVTVSWVFKNESFTYSRTVSNATYSLFKAKAGSDDGTVVPNSTVAGDRLRRYIVTTGDDGLTQNIASYFLNESRSRGWGDYDTIANLVTFMQTYDRSGTFRNLPPENSYRYPYQTFYDGAGTRDDVTIFSGSILEAMGYPVALLVYPRQYDRGYFIYPYEGIAIRSDESVPGTKYYIEQATPVGNVTCSPYTRQYSIFPATSFHPSDGSLRGNTTVCYADNTTLPAGIAEWDVQGGIMSYSDGFYPPRGRSPDHFVMTNASWIDKEYFSYIDTSDPSVLPGTIPGELVKVQPSIITTLIGNENQIRIYRDDRMTGTLQPSLRSPSPLTADGNNETRINFTSGQSITDELGIPVASGDIDEVQPENQQLEDEYWHDVWYDRSNWYYNQKWYLNVLDYDVIENQYLYTRQNEIFIAPATAWRIRYSAVPANPPDKDVPDLSTFSDMRFAVYKVDSDNNTARLFDTFSYGYATGQESIKYRNYYEPGSFYIAVFVRNCEANVAIQMHGKNPA